MLVFLSDEIYLLILSAFLCIQTNELVFSL